MGDTVAWMLAVLRPVLLRSSALCTPVSTVLKGALTDCGLESQLRNAVSSLHTRAHRHARRHVSEGCPQDRRARGRGNEQHRPHALKVALSHDSQDGSHESTRWVKRRKTGHAQVSMWQQNRGLHRIELHAHLR